MVIVERTGVSVEAGGATIATDLLVTATEAGGADSLMTVVPVGATGLLITVVPVGATIVSLVSPETLVVVATGQYVV